MNFFSNFFLILIIISNYCFKIKAFNLPLVDRVKCVLYECCQEPYLIKNFTKLELNLNKHLYGQPLVKRTLLSALKGHLELSNPRKALVLSFHGSTGVGKTYVAQFVADSLLAKGIKSRYYKQFIATKDFPHSEKINEYKEKLKETIENSVKECEYSIFVFDETDKIPLGLVDTIKAYIDFNHEIEGIDFRKSVFIFLSNSASKKIAEITLELDKKNLKREEFELKSFQRAIELFVYHAKDERGMGRATIIEGSLIDFYIPFLPLERIHVKNCIRTELNKYNFKNKKYYVEKQMEQDIDSIANEMIYEPAGLNKYSVSGCKRVPNLVRNLIVESRKDEL